MPCRTRAGLRPSRSLTQFKLQNPPWTTAMCRTDKPNKRLVSRGIRLLYDTPFPTRSSTHAPKVHRAASDKVKESMVGCAISGSGAVIVHTTRAKCRGALFDPERLARAIPCAVSIDQLSPGHFGARLSFGVGPLECSYDVVVVVTPSKLPFEFILSGSSVGAFGDGRATGQVRLLMRSPSQTKIEWHYTGNVGGLVTVAGTSLLNIASQTFCVGFFNRIANLT